MVDLTIMVTKEQLKSVDKSEDIFPYGHIGTHFDVMNKEFPIAYTKLEGLIFDVSKVSNRDIDIDDINIKKLKKNLFVGFYTGFIDQVEYATEKYNQQHPQLSDALIDVLLDHEVAIIGVDFAGIRRGKEHPPKDQYCADKGTFVVENLCNLDKLLNKGSVRINTYPIKFGGMSGLPCRVIGEIL
jgi:kynurenine formamidase